MRIIENKNLRNLLTKGPNYREPRNINFRIAYFEIHQVLEACVENISTKKEAATLTPWRERRKVNHELRVTSYEFKSTSYEFKSPSYEFKSFSLLED